LIGYSSDEFRSWSNTYKGDVLGTWEASPKEEHDLENFYKISRMHGVMDVLMAARAYGLADLPDDWKKFFAAVTADTKEYAIDSLVDIRFKKIVEGEA
jgi:hypothetical protein